MTLGQADYHITKPWMLEQDLYRFVSEFLAEWAKSQEAGFELFHVLGRSDDRSPHVLRELLTRFNVPFDFDTVDTERGRGLLEDRGLDASRLPVMSATTATRWSSRAVFVVGAGNSAGQAALYLARYARQVPMLVRGDSLARSMSDYLIREIGATANIAVRVHTEVVDGHGSDHLNALTIHDRLHDRIERVPAAGATAAATGAERCCRRPRRGCCRAGSEAGDGGLPEVVGHLSGFPGADPVGAVVSGVNRG